MFRSLLMLLPLAAENGTADKFIHLASQFSGAITSAAGGAMGPFADVGRGLGSIFILFVVFTFATNIINGGKFEARMLLPVGVYLCVCFFGIISSTTIAFSGMVNKQCMGAAQAANADMFENKTLFQYVLDNGEAGLTNDQKKIRNLAVMKILMRMGYPEAAEKENPNEGINPEEDTEVKLFGLEKWSGALVEDLKSTVVSFFVKQHTRLLLSKSGADPTDSYEAAKKRYQNGYLIYVNGLPMLICAIMQWIVIIMQNVYIMMGAIMCGIFIAFGPITWSFAIFPGNQKVIGSWLIRVLQFSLYAPICALVVTFSNRLVMMVISTQAGSTVSILLLLCGFFGELAAICSVPSLASMIIEGASGSVALSSGFEALNKTVDTAADIKRLII